MRLVALVIAAGTLAVPLAGAGPQRTTLAFRQVAAGFDSPVQVTAVKGAPSRLYVVEKTGFIRVLVNGKLDPRPFLDLHDQVSDGSEQGLLSIAFHPNYARNRRFYVDYTDRHGDTRVVEYRSNGTRALPGTRRQLLFVDQPYDNHNGGEVAFGPDGLLYVGMGDGGSGGDPGNRAQNLAGRLGKLLRLNVNRRGARWQIAAYGLRNPWRFSWDRATGDLYIGDVGQDAWEEIDFRARGGGRLANYGWSVFEGYEKVKDAPLNPHGELVRPVTVYGHNQGCSVTGGYVYRGLAVPAARGRYFYGDYCSGRIWSLKVVGGQATDVRRETLNVSGLSSFGEDARGELYAVSLEGRIYRLAG